MAKIRVLREYLSGTYADIKIKNNITKISHRFKLGNSTLTMTQTVNGREQTYTATTAPTDEYVNIIKFDLTVTNTATAPNLTQYYFEEITKKSHYKSYAEFDIPDVSVTETVTQTITDYETVTETVTQTVTETDYETVTETVTQPPITLTQTVTVTDYETLTQTVTETDYETVTVTETQIGRASCRERV